MSLADEFSDDTRIDAAADQQLQQLRKTHGKVLRIGASGALHLDTLSAKELAADFRHAVAELGATRAADVWNTLVAGTRAGRLVVLIRNVTADQIYDVGSGAQIVPLDKLDSEHFRLLDGSLKRIGLPPEFVGSFGSAHVAMTLAHSLNTFSKDLFATGDTIMRPLRDLAALLVLCSPCVPHVVGEWWEPADRFFSHDKAGATHAQSGDLMGFASTVTPLSAAMLDHFRANLHAWLQLGEPHQKRFRIALERLRLAGLRRLPVDMVIELGIAMESLLIDGGAKEDLSYRVSLNAAWMLGTSADDRAEVFGVFKYLYNLRSSAVHTGEIDTIADNKQSTPARFRGQPMALVFEAARELLSVVASKRIAAPDVMKNIALRGGS